MDAGDDIAEAMGWRSSFGGGISRYTGDSHHIEEDDEAVEIVEYWEPDRRIFLANGETVTVDGPNPYDDKQLPYVVSRCYTLEHQFWGYSLLHPIYRSQEELNEWRNLSLIQGALNARNVWAVDETIGVPQGMETLDPGDIVEFPFYANGKPGIVPLLQGRPLPPEAYNMEGMIRGDMQRANALPDPVASGTPAKGAETATEVQALAQGTGFRVRLTSVQGELSYLTEVAKLFLSRRQQFFDEETVIRVIGAKAVDYKRMTPQDIAGEYDFMPVGGQVHVSQDVLRQQYMQLLALTKNDPLLQSITDMYELWSEAIKSFPVRFPERFLQPPHVRTVQPQQENLILGAGEWIDVEPNDPHEEHLQVHQVGMARATSQGGGGEKAQEMYQRHIELHGRYLKAAQGQTPPQEQPGQVRGEAGNVPNFQNAVPTQGGIEAMTRGGPGT